MNAQPPPPPPPPPPSGAQQPRPGGQIPPYPTQSTEPSDGRPSESPGLRVLASIGTLVILIVAAIMAAVYVDISGLDPCDEVLIGECYDGSTSTRTVALVVGWPGVAALALASVLSLMYAIRGRGGRTLLLALGAGVVLVGLSLIIG